ncbi:hypothetical protein N7499_012781 [Penicillium canescens]|uniref:Uncharacterized protein n=1 Tax=Penicillium canescens TaxID=5083 RepID=A0AAD6I4W9_PENCN|nr:uncharacterized protein N7446_000573 [Penicillium canescens]KAJ6012250.1 hypothetical protein N7522_002605 [Penicillium canescens]KAJ6030366.1 hypothetical protein N7460_010632 [Penicillium canescens]KAJ6060739.1 hypothetical protein N7444_002593 [Penicillium canescens]KAJ6064101.1 hypothetical protein N7499_012781 [Penicillium canescens]KAJ6077637.1 hypothetical protein N7446_000573 [Penicillium canescens]
MGRNESHLNDEPVHCTGIGDAKEKAVDAAALVPIFTSCGGCDSNYDSHYKLVGHCTVEGGCCRKHRGFDLAVEEKKKYKMKMLGITPQGRSFNPYWSRIYLAAIWGLCIGPDDSPFDMIRPRKEHACSSKPTHTLLNADDESDSAFTEDIGKILL